MLNSFVNYLAFEPDNRNSQLIKVVLLISVAGIAIALLVVCGTEAWGADRIVTWLLLVGLVFLAFLLTNRRDILGAQNVLPFLALVVATRTGIVISRRPISWIGLGAVPLIRGTPLETISATLIVMMISLISFYIGFRSPIAPFLSRALPRPWSPLKGKRVIFLIFCMLWVGAIAQLLLIQRLGGIQFILENIGVRKNTSGLGLLVVTSNLTMDGILICYFLARKKRALGIAVFFGAIVAAFQFWTGRRGNMIPLVAFAVFIYHYKWRPIRIKRLFVIGLTMYILLGVMLLARLYIQYPGYRNAIVANPLKFYFVNMTGDLVVDPMYTIIGHEDGFGIRVWSLDHWYSFVPYMLPRAIFPWKPTYLALPDRIYARYVNPNIPTGIPPTLVGTLYLNAGYLGVILGSYILGLLAKSMVHYRDLNNRSNAALLAYTVAIFVVLQMCRNGDLTNVISMSLSQFGGLFVAYAVALVWRALYETRRHCVGHRRGAVLPDQA